MANRLRLLVRAARIDFLGSIIRYNIAHLHENDVLLISVRVSRGILVIPSRSFRLCPEDAGAAPSRSHELEDIPVYLDIGNLDIFCDEQGSSPPLPLEQMQR